MSRFVVKDSFYNKAKKEGYRARSAYKLKEIQDRYHLLKKGDRVLDLGCAPGSFLQVISEIVGPAGVVCGIDVLAVPALQLKNTFVLCADIRSTDINDVLAKHSIPRFDVITCDIAPNLSGIRDVDNANIEELAMAVMNAVREGLRPDGTFLIKSFFTESLKGIMKDLQKIFRKVVPYKPSASRSVSAEVYLVCLGKIS